MGWFNKKEEDKEKIPSLPELPKLPKLPEFPRTKEDIGETQIYQLPSLPNNSFGQKFSQDTIKDAVTGGKEEGNFEDYENDSQIMPSYPQEIITKPEIPEEFKEIAKKVKENEPIFIRIDKFEDSLNNFEKIKNQISDMEKMFGNIKEVKEKEEAELDSWEKEIKIIKAQIDKIDKTIFSRLQ